MSINRSLSGEPTFGCGKNALRFHCLGYALAAVLTTAAALPQRAYSSEKAAVETPAPKRILILYTLRHSLPINQQWERGIFSAFESEHLDSVVIDVEYLDASRLEDVVLRELWMDLIRRKYEHSQPDLVIPVHDVASALFVNNYQTLFPNASVVFCSLSERLQSQLPLTANMTGVVYRFDYERTIQCALRLWPNARKVVVVSGEGQLDRAVREEFQLCYSGQQHLEIEYWSGIPENVLCEKAKQLPSNCFILFLTHDQDRDGQLNSSAPIFLRRMSSVASVPVFGLSDTLMGSGIVGGYLASPEEQGRLAGKIATRILNGELPSEIPFCGLESNRYVFDHQQLIRWGIPESDLPEGSRILFREASIWQQYGVYLVSGLAAIGLQALMIVGLLVNRQRRLKAESTLADRLRFETLLADVSARLVYVRSDELPRQIEFALSELIDLLGLELALVYDLSRDGRQLQPIASVVRNRESRWTDEIGLDSIPWLWPQLKGGQPIIFSNPSSLPDEAARDKIFLSTLGLKTGLASSLSSQGNTVGIVIFGRLSDVMVWNDTTVQRLQIVTDILRSALTQAHSDSELALSRKNAQQLSGRLLTAIEDERRHLAREMHDDLSQRLALAATEAGKVEHDFGQESARRSLSQLREHLITISEDVHRISRWLHPSILDDLGLADAIRSECARISAQEMIAVNCHCTRLPCPIPQDLSLCLYRVAQESLRNALKHSRTKRIDLTLAADAESLYLSIRDFGCGFDPGGRGGVPGLGIASMQERVRLVNGCFVLNSTLGQGTCVEVTIPLPML